MLCKAVVMESKPWLNFSNNPGLNRLLAVQKRVKLFILSLASKDYAMVPCARTRPEEGINTKEINFAEQSKLSTLKVYG